MQYVGYFDFVQVGVLICFFIYYDTFLFLVVIFSLPHFCFEYVAFFFDCAYGIYFFGLWSRSILVRNYNFI